MSESYPISRRSFLVGLAGSAFLSGCGSLDRYMVEGNRKPKVIILGGGVAGLALALELKKFDISFLICEAQNRTGGRIFSVQESEVNYGELGAEFIPANHSHTLNLLREFRTETTSNSDLLNEMVFLGNWKKQNFSNWLQARDELFQHFEKLVKINGEASLFSERIDLLLHQFKWSSRLRKKDAEELTQSLMLVDYGLPYSDLRGYHLWRSILLGFKHPFHSGFAKAIRVRGGLSILTDSMTDRVAGYKANRLIKYNAPVKEIFQENNQWHVGIQQEFGIDHIQADFVVFAMPWNQIQKVRGMENISLYKNLRPYFDQLESSPMGKALISCNQSKIPNVLADSPLGFYYKTTGLKKNPGLTVSLPSVWGRGAGPTIQDLINRDLESAGLGKLNELSYIHNWTTSSYFEGSFPISFSLNNPKDFVDTEAKLAFIGDYWPGDDFGTINSAIRSAQQVSTIAASVSG